MGKKFFVLLFCLFIAIFAGCNNNKGPTNGGQDQDPLDMIFDPSLDDGKIVFEYPLIPLNRIDYIVPLGSLNPPGHTFPTQHVYWLEIEGDEPSEPPKPSEVFAPAGGKILQIKEFGDSGKDHGIFIGVTNTMTYYIYHVWLDDGYQEGGTVKTGDKLGVRSEFSRAVDLGVLNKEVYNNFINRYYPLDTYYADKPLQYYIEPLQGELYGKVRAESESGPDQDGKFVFDLPGTLSGNWWLKDTVLYWADENYGPKQLAFVYDNIYQDEISISVGKEISGLPEWNITQVFYVQPGAIPPENVKKGDLVYYHLYKFRYLYPPDDHTIPGEPGDPNYRVGLMMVEMLSEDRIKVEVFPDTESNRREFTDAAWEYKR